MDNTDQAIAAPRKKKFSGPAIRWGAVLFGLFLALVTGLYAYSVLDTARRMTDWLLIGPVAILAIAALAVAIIDDIRQDRAGNAPASDAGNGRIGGALAALVLGYAGTVAWIGFDIGTALFVALVLILHGERRVHVLILAALPTAGILVYLFRHVMGVPLPSLLI